MEGQLLNRSLFVVVVMFVVSAFAYGQQVETLYGPVPGDTVRIDQRLNNLIPMDAVFRDETGGLVRLKNFFNKKPVVMTMVYYRCPLICAEVMQGLLAVTRVLKFDAGKEYDIVLISIDPKETGDIAAKKKATFLRTYNREGAEDGWHFLTGDKSEIDKVAEACGYKYDYDPKTGLYAHGAAIWIVTPQGHISQYLKGIEFKATDLRLALVSASDEKIGNLADQITLFCFMWDPSTGKYGLAVLRLMQLAGVLTVLLLGGFIYGAVRKDKNKALIPRRNPRNTDGDTP